MAIQFLRGTTTQVASASTLVGQPAFDMDTGMLSIRSSTGEGAYCYPAIEPNTYLPQVGDDSGEELAYSDSAYALMLESGHLKPTKTIDLRGASADDHYAKLEVQDTYAGGTLRLGGLWTGATAGEAILDSNGITPVGATNRVYWPSASKAVSNACLATLGEVAAVAPVVHTLDVSSNTFSWTVGSFLGQAHWYGYAGMITASDYKVGDIISLKIKNPISNLNSTFCVTVNQIADSNIYGTGFCEGLGPVYFSIASNFMGLLPAGARAAYEMTLAHPLASGATMNAGVKFKAAPIAGSQSDSVSAFASRLSLLGFRSASRSYPISGYTFSQSTLSSATMSASDSWLDSVYVGGTSSSGACELTFCRNGTEVITLPDAGSYTYAGQSVTMQSTIATSYSFGWREDILTYAGS